MSQKAICGSLVSEEEEKVLLNALHFKCSAFDAYGLHNITRRETIHDLDYLAIYCKECCAIQNDMQLHFKHLTFRHAGMQYCEKLGTFVFRPLSRGLMALMEKACQKAYQVQ